MKLAAVVLASFVFVGCASREHFLWQEYTSEGIAAVGAGDYPRAERFFARALAKANDLGPKEQGIALNGLGELYRRQGRLGDAERTLLRALEVKEQGLGPNHPDVATSLANLGLLYVANGRELDAAPLLERALAIQERRPEKASWLRTMATLAEVYRRLGRDHDAFVLETRVKLLRDSLEQ